MTLEQFIDILPGFTTWLSIFAIFISCFSLAVSYKRLKSQEKTTDINLENQYSKKAIGASKILSSLKILNSIQTPISFDNQDNHKIIVKTLLDFKANIESNSSEIITCSNKAYSAILLTEPHLVELSNISDYLNPENKIKVLRAYNLIFSAAEGLSRIIKDYYPHEKVIEEIKSKDKEIHEMRLMESEKVWKDISDLIKELKLT